jgi:hypothetical protein
VYNGQCKNYLLDKAKGIIQREIPYRRAIEIAKIIDLSSSVLNLSECNTLCRGMGRMKMGRLNEWEDE